MGRGYAVCLQRFEVLERGHPTDFVAATHERLLANPVGGLAAVSGRITLGYLLSYFAGVGAYPIADREPSNRLFNEDRGPPIRCSNRPIPGRNRARRVGRDRYGTWVC